MTFNFDREWPLQLAWLTTITTPANEILSASQDPKTHVFGTPALQINFLELRWGIGGVVVEHTVVDPQSQSNQEDIKIP